MAKHIKVVTVRSPDLEGFVFYHTYYDIGFLGKKTQITDENLPPRIGDYAERNESFLVTHFPLRVVQLDVRYKEEGERR